MNDLRSQLDFPFERPPAPGEAIALAPDVLWIRMPLPFALDHINLWLLRTPDGFVAVDTGYGAQATRALWEQHFAGTLGGEPIVRVVATHYHPDHVGNAAWLSQRFGCPVTMTLAEFMTAHAVRQSDAGYAPADVARLFVAHGLAEEHAIALERRGNAYVRGVPELPASFERVLDGEAIAAGSARWRVIEGFGHSPEHAALHSAEHRLLISGDMLLPTISTNIPVWAHEADGDPLARFLDSLRRFESLPPDTLVLPSHGLPFRGIAARVRQLEAHHAARLTEVVEAVRARGGEVSAADVVPLLFRRELDLQQRFFAMGEAIAHLNRLWHGGTLARRQDGERRVRFGLARDGADARAARPSALASPLG